MKKISIFLSTTFIFQLSFAQNAAIEFKNYISFSDLQNASRKENKTIFIDIYATWCAPCKMMDQKVYSNSEVINYLNQKFISIKIQSDTSKSDDETTKKKYELAKQIINNYKIKSYPTFLFISPEGYVLHRDQGFLAPNKLISVCKVAEDTLQNDLSLSRRYKNNQLSGDQLLTYAMKLIIYDEDSMANIVAQKYIDSTLNKEPILQQLTPILPDFFNKFSKKFSASSPMVKWISANEKETDSKVQLNGFSAHVINKIIKRDILNHETSLSDTTKTPRWEKIKSKIVESWPESVADRIILDSKISYYEKRHKWDSMITYQLKQIDQLEDNKEMMQAVSVNNFIWNIVLKHSTDQQTLNKSCKYLEEIISIHPNVPQFMDTYANLLYRTGKKERALLTEKEALSILEKDGPKDDIDSYKETIRKMEANKAIEF